MIPDRPEGALLDAVAAAPAADVDALAPGPVLLLSPHPDDEVLGAGLAMDAALGAGRPVLVLLVTDGAASHPGSRTHPPQAVRALRRAEFRQALAELGGGGAQHDTLEFADSTLTVDSAVLIANRITERIGSFRPAVIWTTWSGDPHCDHEATASAAALVGSRLGVPVWEYAVWGRFGARPVPPRHRLCRFLHPDGLPRKQRAAHAYRSQFTALIRDDPDGFRMPSALLAHFLSAPEVFIGPAARA
ncbi:PIG-L deacetylase family protein [Qipengyuania thermophila]|uniref:PIG-L deacetylase family protein n=1 Tax=Qipengyuania thermophila TaxID=2509361 RepID=UPI0013EA60C8|nr:PIG-L family deacetylase [Qipengyuania thermophila]